MLFAALLAATAAQGAAPVLSTHDPQTIVRYLQEEGYRAKLATDGVGDPVIRSGSGGTGFSVLFYGCKNHKNCADVQFQAAWDFEENNPETALINRWNAEKRFTKAYLDKEDDPFLEMDVIFTDGRMARATFGEHLDVFLSGLAGFEKHVGWPRSEPAAAPTTSATPLTR